MRAQRDRGDHDHAERGRAQEDVRGARHAHRILGRDHQQPVEIHAGRRQRRRVEGPLRAVRRLDQRAEAAVRGGRREQTGRHGRAPGPGRALERRHDPARKAAPERGVELAQAAPHHGLLGERERLRGGPAVPRRQGGPQPVEGGATLVERSEGSHGRPMVIERMFDVN